jgi:hypothetical protein
VLVAAICYLAVELGIRVIIEQPNHSWFYKTPQMMLAIERLGFQSISTDLGAFGVLCSFFCISFQFLLEDILDIFTIALFVKAWLFEVSINKSQVIAGGIPKPLQLMGNARFLPRLRQHASRARPINNEAYRIDPDGGVTGAAGLSATGAYPIGFGRLVVQCYEKSLSHILREIYEEQNSTHQVGATPISSGDARNHFFLRLL